MMLVSVVVAIALGVASMRDIALLAHLHLAQVLGSGPTVRRALGLAGTSAVAGRIARADAWNQIEGTPASSVHRRHLPRACLRRDRLDISGAQPAGLYLNLINHFDVIGVALNTPCRSAYLRARVETVDGNEAFAITRGGSTWQTDRFRAYLGPTPLNGSSGQASAAGPPDAKTG
jgi:hypothetical protein